MPRGWTGIGGGTQPGEDIVQGAAEALRRPFSVQLVQNFGVLGSGFGEGGLQEGLSAQHRIDHAAVGLGVAGLMQPGCSSSGDLVVVPL